MTKQETIRLVKIIQSIQTLVFEKDEQTINKIYQFIKKNTSNQ